MRESLSFAAIRRETHQGIHKEEYIKDPVVEIAKSQDVSMKRGTRDNEFLPFVIESIINLDGDKRPYLEVDVLGYKIVGLLDSGACCTIMGGEISQVMLEKLGIKERPISTAIKTADGAVHEINSCADVPYLYNGQCQVVSTLVAPTFPRDLILGIDFWEAFRIKPSVKISEIAECFFVEDAECNNPDEPPNVSPAHVLDDIQLSRLNEVKVLFRTTQADKLGCTTLITHKIDTGDATGTKTRARPISPYIQDEMDAEIDRMLNLGVIEKAQPTEWAHPVVCVRKPSGKLRFCLDARKLNAVTVKDTYPLPYINRILGRLNGTKYLSSIDLSDAFWQIELETESRSKTAFIVPGRGLYQYRRMPFGLCNASQTLARLMDKVLGYDLEPRVFVYLDDIIVMSQSFEEHITLLAEVAQRLNKAGLSISLSKSHFCLKEIRYLGYILDEYGLRVDPEKINGILNLKTPRTIKDIRRLIGLAGWYRRFIPDFSTITAPITNLLKKEGKNKFDWTVEAQAAFVLLKSRLVASPILANPDFTQKFTIQTDASDVGLGAVLTQGDGDTERVIAFMSQKLSSTQRKYPATERECLAVVLAIEKFRPYIEGVTFDVITDCASLLWLRNLKDPASRLARWAMRLQQYEFQLHHRKGKLNVVPDALSRAVELIEMRSEDKHDEGYDKIIKGLQNDPQKFPEFQLKDGKLFKYVQNKNGLGVYENVWRLFVPLGSRQEVLRRCHDDPLAAHMGVAKTLQRVKDHFYWPRMAYDTEKYVQKCESCQLNKYRNASSRAPMGLPKSPSRPWQMVAIDYMGPYPRSKRGNQYLLVVIDIFSKFTMLKPMRRAETGTLLNYMEDSIFLVFGVPEVIITDNAKQFTAKNTKSFFDKYGVTHWTNAYYHPQNNPAERVNRSILSAIRCYLKGDQREWDENIGKIACAIRTAVHESSKFSPYFVNFGRNMDLNQVRCGIAINEEPEDDINTRKDRMEKVFSKVQENLNKAYEKYSHRYNLRSRPKNFEVDDIVLRKNFKQSKAVDHYNAKLDTIFVKCKISKKLGTNTYELVDMSGKFIGKFHANDIIPFRQ